MLPVIASINAFNFQTPLVNTTTQGTNILHVPYDNVAPSVAGVEIENNTQGNNTIILPAPEPAVANNNTAPEQGSGNAFATQLQSVFSYANSGVQAGFVAQLAAQDSSPEAEAILVQYAKIIANSNVKYKPSNALKPPPSPAGIFGKILQSEKQESPAPVAVQPQPVVTPNAPVAEAVRAAPVPQVTPLPHDEPAAALPTPVVSNGTTATEIVAASAPAVAAAIPPRAINAYAEAVSRISNPPPATEAVTGAKLPANELA